MTVLAIDPGTHDSAYVVWTGGAVFAAGIEPNETLLEMLKFGELTTDPDVIAIEMVACYGMAVGKEVFETCVWIGRFHEHCRPAPRLVYRREVKMHHCNSAKAKDANIRQALIDKYGAPGVKKNPGVTYGLKSHLWAAFAIATFISETSASFKSEDTGPAPEIPGVPDRGAEIPSAQTAVIQAVTGP